MDGHRKPATHGERHGSLAKGGDNGPEFLEEIGHVRLQQAYTTSGARDNEIGYAPERSAAARGRFGAVAIA
jgi:hypothetical protein